VGFPGSGATIAAAVDGVWVIASAKDMAHNDAQTIAANDRFVPTATVEGMA
jgi:hypothetical protein